jgi:hypothetical protein
MKSELARRQFSRPSDLRGGIDVFRDEIQMSGLPHVFHHWIERVRWVSDHDGYYFYE